jgi:hypothetical protein
VEKIVRMGEVLQVEKALKQQMPSTLNSNKFPNLEVMDQADLKLSKKVALAV